jgi:peptide/nickel transport system permease protein
MNGVAGAPAALGGRRAARTWSAVRGRPTLMIGGAIVVAVMLIALLAPALVRYPPTEFHVRDRLTPPSAAYWFGTDEFGRDVYSRVIIGARLSVLIGFVAMAVCMGAGTPLGLLAGYVGGRTDEVMMRGLDILMAFPSIIFGMLILTVTSPGPFKTAIAVGIVYAPTIARIARSVTLAIKEEDYVAAARSRGESPL